MSEPYSICQDTVNSNLKEMCDKYKFSYLIMGQEYTPTTNKMHVDGYYEYPCARKIGTELNKFNKHFGNGFGDLREF